MVKFLRKRAKRICSPTISMFCANLRGNRTPNVAFGTIFVLCTNMKRLVLAFLFFFGCISIAAAQGFMVFGKVVSQANNQPIEMATIRLFAYSAADSTLIQGVQTDMEGRFRLEGIRAGKYKLIVSSVGFTEQHVNVVVQDKDVRVRPIRLAEEVQRLSQVEVTGKAAELTVKGDTIEYNTSAYRTNENDMVEDLLKKMSGVQVDADGKVTVNGEEIKQVRIDGKKFFENDPQMATKNIPADMIDKIQVIDEKSEMAKLTGFEDEDTERIINLQLKKSKKKGVFGNFNLAGGADMLADNGEWFGYNNQFMQEDFRYNANLFMNILLGESQTTLIAGGNNTNQPLSMRGRGPMMGNNSGITATENIGVNTNVDKGRGLEFGADASLNHSRNNTLTQSEKESYADSIIYNNLDSTSKQTDTWDANVRMEWEWKIDSVNKLTIRPQIGYTYTQSNNYQEYDYLRNGEQLTLGTQRNNGISQDINARLRLTYSHKFQKKGRALTLRGDVRFTNSTSDSHNSSELLSLGVPEMHNFHTLKDNNSLTYSLKASYVEPIYGKNHFLETAFTFENNLRNSEKMQYNDSARTLLDSTYSNTFYNRYFSEKLELNYQYKQKDYDLTVGVQVNPSQTISETTYIDEESTRVIENNVWNVSPSMSFKYKFGKKEFARIRYRGTSSQPSISQMEPVRDNSNAMSETVGNLGLNPAFSHNLLVMYSKFNQERFSSIMTGLRGTLTKDAFVRNSIYDETGKLYAQTVNAQALPWNVSADFMYNTPFANKLMQFNTRTMLSYNQRVAYISKEQQANEIAKMIDKNALLLGEENRTGNLQAREDLTLRFTHQWIEIGANASFTYSRTHNSLNPQNTSNVFNWSVRGDLALHLPKNWNITADCGYTARYGYQLDDVNEIMLNASISKTWRNATLALEAYDLLNQKKNIVQVVGEDYVQYRKYNTLPTYFMLTFTYKLNKMGDLKAKGKGGRMQEMMESGGRPPMGPPSGPPPGGMPPGPPPMI